MIQTMFKNKKKSMETDPKSGGTPPLMENSILFFFFFIEPFPYQKASTALIMIHNPIFFIPSIPVVADETERMK